MKAPAPKVKLDTAIDFFGGARPLAKFLDVSPEAIYKLVREEKTHLPPLRAFEVVSTHPELIDAEAAA